MIDAAGIRRLLGTRSAGQGIVSVYLNVPLDPAQRRGMPAHLDDMLAQGDPAGTGSRAWENARRSELPVIRREIADHAHQWPGRGVAIFSCTELGLREAIPLRGHVTERAVIGDRPYIRPLLAELQRCPGYLAAVVDRRHAWLFRVSGEEIEPVDHVQSQTVGSKRFGGWHGLAAYRNERRARTLARQHYAAAAAAMAAALPDDGCGPVVVGGHEAETREFIGALPPALARRVAGTFVIDPHTMTPARIRQLAGEVVAGWEEDRERQLAAALAEQAPSAMTAIGLEACLAAANEHAIQLLMLPDDGSCPGYRCGECGHLAVEGGRCRTCDTPTDRVGDVVEELAVKVMQEGGTVQPVRGGNLRTGIAARRRFPGVPARPAGPEAPARDGSRA